MEETILVGDDLMLGPPSPLIPPEIASHVLEGVNLCDGILRNLFLCLQINDIEPFCQDELVLYRQCAEKRDIVLRKRLQESEHKLGLSMPLDDAKERAAQLESQITSLDRRLILASGMEGVDGFRQRWSLHGRLSDIKMRLESLKQGIENRKKDEQPVATRSRPSTALAGTAKTPSTPPTPQNCSTRTRTRTRKSICTIRKALIPDIGEPAPNHELLQWTSLNLPRSELSLPLTFPTGQTFRWRKTGEVQYTGVVRSHLISLKHLDKEDGQVAYCLHKSRNADEAEKDLLDFLNAEICMADLWKEFSASDNRFAELARHLGGARVLRQDPLECLMQFLCSSNNGIVRITRMVEFLSELGNYLGHVEGFDFYEFPTLKQLSEVSEKELRDAGFGYRASYIVSTVKALQSKSGGGLEWLASLRTVQLKDAIDALLTLKGVGPKVAACVALFSLDQHDAIPVDTHVWKVGTTYLLPELAGTSLTLKQSLRVADAFISKYGKYAGWAQNLLFIAELPAQRLLIPDSLHTIKVKRPPGIRKHVDSS
ncbi:unnamed protein product [Rhodiola kirilowii]